MALGPRTLLLAVSTVCLIGCDPIERNYLKPDEPRYAGDHTVAEPTPGDVLRVVSYNLLLGREVAVAVAALGSEPLAGADVILMQEMNAEAIDELAAALQLRYVLYPASVKHGQDWGNAVLSRWPLVDDHKVLLPHADPYTNSRRIAVAARVDFDGVDILAYSTHIATPSLGLGARLDQVEAILDDAADVAPALIGGDFNTADPGSADQMIDLLGGREFTWASDDATATGTAFGLTDATLDYVFARGLSARASGTFTGEAGSDHRPVWVEIDLP